MGFRERLHDLRKEAGMSQEELGAKLGVTHAMIGYMEQGYKVPSVALMMDIAKFFGVSLDYLNGLTDKREIE